MVKQLILEILKQIKQQRITENTLSNVINTYLIDGAGVITISQKYETLLIKSMAALLQCAIKEDTGKDIEKETLIEHIEYFVYDVMFDPTSTKRHTISIDDIVYPYDTEEDFWAVIKLLYGLSD